LPAVRDVSRKYHIHGSLIIAPSEMFSKSVKACAPLFNVATSAKKILLSPLPRYWHARCCDDDDHVANLDEPGICFISGKLSFSQYGEFCEYG
jgi:hypothetical protein